DVGQDEAVELFGHRRVVQVPDVAVELQGELRDEVVHGRGIGAHAQLQQRQGKGLCRGQATEVEQAVAVARVDAGQVLDVAGRVLEPDEVLVAGCQPGDRLRGVDRVGAVVDDDADLRRGANPRHVGLQTRLVAFGQVWRQ